MGSKQEYCECGNGLLIVRISEDKSRIILNCLECKKSFELVPKQTFALGRKAE